MKRGDVRLIELSIKVLVVLVSVPTVVTSMLIWYLQRSIAKREKGTEVREQDREDMEYLLLNTINASMSLSEATARAVQNIPDAHCNGDMTKALKYAEDTKHELKNYLNRKAVEKVV